jgi:hypothetical protein
MLGRLQIGLITTTKREISGDGWRSVPNRGADEKRHRQKLNLNRLKDRNSLAAENHMSAHIVEARTNILCAHP